MDATLSSLLSFYVFSTGRRMFALGQVKEKALAAGHAMLAAHCDVALAHDTSVRVLEARWLGQLGDGSYSPEARQLDILVDSALGAMRDAIDAAARASDPGDPLGDAAATLVNELFPLGVADITTRSFVDELGEVGRVLGTVTSPEWAPKVAELGISRHVVRLTALEAKYRAAIVGPGSKLQFPEVKDARARGQALLLQAIAMILGLHPSETPEDLAARGALLAPILRQNAAIRDYLRVRRAVQDVNPQTGELEPIPAPAAETTQVATPPAASPATTPA